jgi:predicted PurR-regulated permease PerM
MEYTEDQDCEKIIKKLKRKILFLKIIIFLFIAVLITSAISGYFLIKPYIEKFNELSETFQNIQPYIDQLGQLKELSKIAGSSQELQSAINTLNSLSKNIKEIENTVNDVKNNLQWPFNLLTK